MALILMTRGAVRLANGFGYALKMIWHTIRCCFSKEARTEWTARYNPEKRPLYKALFWWVVIPINAIMQIFWATSGQVPAPFNGVTLEKSTLAPVAFLQSFLLMYRTTMPRFTGRYRQDMRSIVGRLNNCRGQDTSWHEFATGYLTISDLPDDFEMHPAPAGLAAKRGRRHKVIDLMVRAALIAHCGDAESVIDDWSHGALTKRGYQALFHVFRSDSKAGGIALADLNDEQKIAWADYIFQVMRLHLLQQRPRFAGTRRVLGRLWELGLVRWLTKGVGLGGAVWFIWPVASGFYSLSTHGGSLAVLFGGLSPWFVPVVMLIACAGLVLLGTELVLHQIRRRRLGETQVIEKSEQRDGMLYQGTRELVPLVEHPGARFALEVSGAVGTAWFLAGGIPMALGVGMVTLYPWILAVMGAALVFAIATHYNSRFANFPVIKQLKALWLEVLGAGAATWFLWSGVKFVAAAALSASFIAVANYVVLGLVAAVTIYALWCHLRGHSANQIVSDAQSGEELYQLYRAEGDAKFYEDGQAESCSVSSKLEQLGGSLSSCSCAFFAKAIRAQDSTVLPYLNAESTTNTVSASC